MLIRFLGKIFLYFYVIPEVAHFTRKIAIPAISSVVVEHINESIEEDKKNKAKSRDDHPAGSRLS